MLLCQDCLHCGERFGAGSPACQHPKALWTQTDVVDGTSRTDWLSCTVMRLLGPCGPDAKLFQAKTEESGRCG
jgi:hypothetical protein